MKKKTVEDYQIADLEKLAKTVLDLKTQPYRQNRPIFIEFCGTPKSGKTTVINALNIFLKRNGFVTTILTERASVCPVQNKKHPYFNIWTFSSTIVGLIKLLDENIENPKLDVIIADRGIFDSLCWFDWLYQQNAIDKFEYDDITNFITLKIFLQKIDLIYIFKTDPKTSMLREHDNLLTRKPGSIMNKKVLGEFIQSIERVEEKFKNKFVKHRAKIKSVDTSNINQSTVSKIVTVSALETLSEILNEKIGYFDDFPFGLLKKGINGYGFFIEYLKKKEIDIEFDIREKVENSNNIQPVPIAVITDKNRERIICVKKRLKRLGKKSPEKDKLLTYIGGHIRSEDNKKSWVIEETFLSTLERELYEEVGLKIKEDNIKERIVIYNPKNDRSKKHIAVCYLLEIDIDKFNFNPNMDELLKRTVSTKKSILFTVEELKKLLFSGQEKTEFWSSEILTHFFSFQDIPTQSTFDFDFSHLE